MDTTVRPAPIGSTFAGLRPAAFQLPAQRDTAVIGQAPETLPGFPQFGVFNIKPEQAETPQGRQVLAEQMAAQLKAWPAMTAVVGVVPEGQNTGLIVANRPDAAADSKLEGFYDIMQRLCSSSTVRSAAVAHPDAVQPVHNFDAQGLDREVTLGGQLSLKDVASELAEGGQPDRDDQLKALIDSLPKGQRVVILVGGPSAAGKSTLINQIAQMAGDRKVVDYTGDNYFRNVDDPALPKTAAGGPYWDAPDAMNMPELAGDIGKLASTGHVDEPNYDFSAKSPDPKVTGSGMRTGQTTPVDLGPDDILCIDSLHAMNPVIIKQLETAKLPYACVYLDSSEGNIREVRRIVRDFTDRGRTPESSINDWKTTTFPGEVSYIRPTIDQLEPGRDVFRITRFPADVDLSQAEIEDRVKVQEQFGVQPTYAAFHVADADMAAFAKSEVTRFQGTLADPKSTDAQRQAAEAGLASLKASLR